MNRKEKLLMRAMNLLADIVGWMVDSLIRNVQAGINLFATIIMAAVPYAILVAIGLSKAIVIIICALVMLMLFVYAEAADSYIWLVLPNKFYWRFLMFHIRLRATARGNSIVLSVTLVAWLIDFLALLLKPFGQNTGARLSNVSSVLRTSAENFRLMEMAKLQTA